MGSGTGAAASRAAPVGPSWAIAMAELQHRKERASVFGRVWQRERKQTASVCVSLGADLYRRPGSGAAKSSAAILAHSSGSDSTLGRWRPRLYQPAAFLSSLSSRCRKPCTWPHPPRTFSGRSTRTEAAAAEEEQEQEQVEEQVEEQEHEHEQEHEQEEGPGQNEVGWVAAGTIHPVQARIAPCARVIRVSGRLRREPVLDRLGEQATSR